MPMARQKSSTGLSITLLDDRKYYTPGSKVTGNVSLDTASDFAIGSVSLEFYGRVKVYYVQSHGQGESVWRGRAPLFSDSSTLFEGYHTHRPGSFSWPFTFEIPINPDVAAIKQSKHQWKEKPPYISTDDYIPAHPMPPTFDFRKWGFGYRWHAFVEYVLKVEVKQAEGARMMLPPSSRKTTLPVMVKHVSNESPDVHCLPLAVHFSLPDQITEKAKLDNSQPGKPQLQNQVFTPTVRSSRLLTWNKSTTSPTHVRAPSFSLREKTKQVLKSNSLPRYTFKISVSVPETIQLLKENSVPIVVTTSSVRDNDSTTIQPEDYPDVRIDNVSLSATAVTYIRCKGPFPPRPCSYDIKLLERHPVDYTIRMNPRAAERRNTSDRESSDEGGPNNVTNHNTVDLSQLPGLATALIAAKMGLQTEKPLSISFNTYIIARAYKLNWKLELDVVGEKVKIQNDSDIPVTVLPPEHESLEVLMNEEDATQAQNHEEEEANGEQSDDSNEVQDTKGKAPMSNFLKKRRGKKTKAEEAAEETAAAATVPESSTSGPLQFQNQEMLPRYEQAPTDFGYRHEIDERPPSVEPTMWQAFLQNVTPRFTKSPVIA